MDIMYKVKLETFYTSIFDRKMTANYYHNTHVVDNINRIPIHWLELDDIEKDYHLWKRSYYDLYVKRKWSKFNFESTNYQIITFIEKSKEKMVWCLKNCSESVGFKYTNSWYFKNKEDMIAFKMRWL